MKNGVCPRLVASLTLSNKLRLFDLVQLHPTFSSKQAKKPYNNTKSSQLVMASNGEMSHAEMWDDSALVDSWNDAVEEYKVVISLVRIRRELILCRNTIASKLVVKMKTKF